MSKFKVGDKIVIPPEQKSIRYRRELRGVITEILTYNIFGKIETASIKIKYNRYGEGLHFPDELVLEEVYNSSLYKLMREENGT